MPYGKIPRYILGLFLLGNMGLMPLEAPARNTPPGMRGSTFTLALENDIVARTDHEYTHGIKLTWVLPDLSRPGDPDAKRSDILDPPLMKDPGYLRNISISLGQTIFTPHDIEYWGLIEDDRPYSGIAYAAIGIHRMNNHRMDTLEFTTGVVGPHSYAEYLQDRAHDTFSADKPHGWRNQLDDEILLNVFLGRKWRMTLCQSGRHRELDILPHIGISLGNALTALNAGGQIRFGRELPHDYGISLIGPGSGTDIPMSGADPRFSLCFPGFSLHVFAGIEGYAVARDISLDGNSYCESHHVEKKPLVAELIVGAGMLFSGFKITYAHVYRTRSFEKQEKGQVFGSITVSYSL